MNADNPATCRFCAECGYEVTGVTGNICPECGTSPLATTPKRRGYRQSFWFALVVVGGHVLVWDGLMWLISANSSGSRYGGWFWLLLMASPPTVAFAASLIPACAAPLLRREHRRFAIELSREILWVVLMVCYALLAALVLLALGVPLN